MRLFFLPLSVLVSATTLAGQAGPQISGGTCSASSLKGNYSILLSTQSAGVVSPGSGTAMFDGVSTVQFTLATAAGSGENLAGAYSINPDCTGAMVVPIVATGASLANFSLTTYSGGAGLVLTGQDGTNLYAGSGTILPATCNAAMLSGSYGFSGPAYGEVPGVISGVIQFDGRNSVKATWSATTTYGTTSTSLAGYYIVTPSCIGSATTSEIAGNPFLTLTVVSGADFVLSGATPVTGSEIPMQFAAGASAIATPQGCTQATLTGVRSLWLNGVESTAATGSTGTANFDGLSRVSFTLDGVSLLGDYSVRSDCTGSIVISVGEAASYSLIAYNNGRSLSLTGSDGTYVYTGNAGMPPASCITASLSGSYAVTAAGLSAGNPMNLTGLLTFNGRGGVNAEWSAGTSLSASPDTATGQYTIEPTCQGAATLLDPSGIAYVANFAVTATDNSQVAIDLNSSSGALAGTAFATFTPPGMAGVNGASFAPGATPAGSEFVLFGNGLTSGASAQAGKPPLPRTLLSTGVTVNGESAPLYFVSETQLNAQMPVDAQSGLAAVTVTVNGVESNTAAVAVPASAAPGIYFYNTDRGIFQNPDYSLNSATNPAHPGDVAIAWFTGGGSVEPASPLTSGAGSPAGLSPVTANSTIRIGGIPAAIDYIGLAPDLVGVYQANFVVPAVPAGNQTVVISIGGVNSQGELITIGQ